MDSEYATKFKSLFKQFLKFGVIGLINAIIQLGVYSLLIALGLNDYVSNFVGFLLSVTNSYLWNNLWVFKDHKVKDKSKVIKFFSTYIFTFLLSNIWLFLLLNIFNFGSHIAEIIVICINTPINFIVSKLWVFERKKGVI